jgi:UDP-3-O-[3-hydroxymyristoyl] glucosamine N-acyltransferase
LPKYSLGEIAKKINGQVRGDPDVEISGVAGLEDAKQGDISFLANPKYLGHLSTTRATAVIIGQKNGSAPEEQNYLVVENPYLTFLRTVQLFYPTERTFKHGIHPMSAVDPSAEIGERVYIGPFVVVGVNARIGNDVVLQARSYVGSHSLIGDGTRLMPGAVVLDSVVVGRRCLLQSGCVLGGDGFGFVCDKEGQQQKIPQVSGLVVGDDVEIGANTTIDRGTLAPTKIGNGVKFDNLVHIAHNVEIGDNTLVVAQVGVSGSTKIGSSVTLAGQSGVGGHITVGDEVRVGAQAGVTKSIPPKTAVSGYPARPHAEALRAQASLSRLPNLLRQIKNLVQRVGKLEDKINK